MRYVCEGCGEGEKWTIDAPGRASFNPPRSEMGESTTSSGSHTVSGGHSRTRSHSMTTNASRGSGSVGSPNGQNAELPDSDLRRPLPWGYELCPGCIETHGIAHAKAAAKLARRLGDQAELRHAFREKIWSGQGWVDVGECGQETWLMTEYSDELDCTICRAPVFQNRFKCVSCPAFDLCRSCYQKVSEIHPAHAFLSLPDPTRQPVLENQPPARHLGAFCHNCLQDIVGPRFHCAVCPSWDLCIQCEGIAGVGSEAGHMADHIMMKIPLPLASSEVEVVSRLARDRWFQQDSDTVAGKSLRSSSPSGDILYAANVRADGLDHQCKCDGCSKPIMGRRYQCANCPSLPYGFNLVSCKHRPS